MSNENEVTAAGQAVTAQEVENNCPPELQKIGEHIAAHFKKACGYDKKADEHYVSIAQYLAQARAACDGGGFDAFREKYCPSLGRTRAYELVAVGEGKISLEDLRAGNRYRVAEHRAKKANASVTVTDKGGAEPKPPGRLVGVGTVETTGTGPGQKLFQPTLGATAVEDFDHHLQGLIQLGDWTQAGKFIDTVPLDTLHTVIKFLVRIYELKEKRGEKLVHGRAEVSQVAAVAQGGRAP